MQSKTSWFNKEVFIQDFRNVGWVSLLFFVGLFFTVPVKILFVFSNKERYVNSYVFNEMKNVFLINWPLQVMLYFVVPILLAVFLFRYLHVKAQVDMVHSFPVTRTQLYVQHMTSGLLLLWTPILVIALIILLLIQPLDATSYISYTEVFEWFGTIVLFETFMFTFGVFMGMLTGISAVQGILSYIFLFFPFGFSMLLIMNMKKWFYGLPANYLIFDQLLYYSPLTRLPLIIEKDLMGMEVFIYLFFIIGFSMFSAILYKRRPLEMASHAIAFSQLKPLFKYGVAFCFMLLGGLYFTELEQTAQTSWVYFGYVTFSIIGYFIAEMVIQKSWRVFHMYKGYLAYAVVMVILFSALQFDITGYEKKLPELSEIESVYFSPYVYRESVDHENMIKEHSYRDKNNIETIYRLHEEMIANKDKRHVGSDYEEVNIIYTLKNGDKLTRQYILFNKEQYKPYFNELYQSDEYKQNRFDVLRVMPEEVDKITVFQYMNDGDRSSYITNPAHVKEVVEILKDEIKQADYDVLDDTRHRWGNMTLTLSNGDQHSVEGYVGFEQLSSYLEKNGYKMTSRQLADEISHMLIAKQEDLQQVETRRYAADHEVFEKADQYDFIVKVTDKEKIAEALENTTGYRRGTYTVAIYYKGEKLPDLRSLEEHAVKQLLE